MKARSVNIKEIQRSMRMDGSFQNAEINVFDSVLRKHSESNLSYYCSSIFTSGRNKRVYTDSSHGVPFLSNSDMISAHPFEGCNFSSRKYGFDKNAVLTGGMILTGRVGAIGQIAYVPKYWERYDAMGSDNIIRIVVKPQYYNGYIYAYLASKYGNLSFWKHATGGVQPFITDKMVGQLPIPVFPKEFQREVDELIQSSARLREEAADLLAEAKNVLLDFVNTPFEGKKGCKTAKRTLKDIKESLQMRLDPPALMNESVITFEKIKNCCVKLGECKVKTWYPGMFKRCYVADGLPYMQGSSVFESNPFRHCDHLSASRTPKLDELWLTDGLILIACAGTCGQVKLITKEYEDKRAIGSPDIIRLQSSDSLFTQEYLFVYLQLPIVQDYMQSFKYGSVIERFDALRVESIPVVKPTKELSEKITSLINRYKDCMYNAFCNEEKAISMVEAEIEKWNK